MVLLVTTYISSGMTVETRLVDFHALGAPSTSDTITDQSGMGLKVVEWSGNQNSDGIANEQDFHQAAFMLPTRTAWR